MMISGSVTANPILVEVRRGHTVESVHRGAVAVMDAKGRHVLLEGDVDRPIFPRSAVKMIQALPLLESGAADRFQLADSEIALACASHSGEPGHVAAVEGWLSRIGFPVEALECGSHDPFDEKSARALAAAHHLPSPLHNNCSGKHAGFLTTARHLGLAVRDYVRKSHPLQQHVTMALGEMTEFDLGDAPCGIDGCGIPAYAIPLRHLALAMAKIASPGSLTRLRAQAAGTIVRSMLAQPWLVAGSGRFDTRAIEAGGRKFVVKMGAEGVHVAIIPAKGLGVALKIDDGTRRAGDTVMAQILHFLGLIDESQVDELGRSRLINSRGELAGRLCPIAFS
jgi:L-asparaginase II